MYATIRPLHVIPVGEAGGGGDRTKYLGSRLLLELVDGGQNDRFFGRQVKHRERAIGEGQHGAGTTTMLFAIVDGSWIDEAYP